MPEEELLDYNTYDYPTKLLFTVHSLSYDDVDEGEMR